MFTYTKGNLTIHKNSNEAIKSISYQQLFYLIKHNIFYNSHMIINLFIIMKSFLQIKLRE